MNPRIRRFQRDPDVARRVKVVTYAALAIFLLLLIRLYYLQVVRFEEYSRLAEENRVRLRPIRAPRGLILDRDGEIVADSVPAFTLVCTPVDVVDLEGELALLSRIVALDLEDVKERIEEAARTNPYGTLRLASDLSFDQVAKVEEFSEDIPGFFISYEVRRNYPMGNLFSHVVGYVSEASVQDLRTLKEAGVEFGDFVGKRGVERVYENILHGRNGVRKIEVDALGREKREIERTPPVQGKTVVLTVDADLQRKAAELFRGKEGGVVALDPRTGEVLCLYSSPTFDPNIFPKGITKAQWESLVRHRGHPFQNRVTQGRYSPGSTVKPIYALFALDEGMVSWGTDFFCSGEFTLGDSTFRCWKKGGHGEVSLRTAIVQSCDVYFYNLGLLAGIDSLSRWMKEAGFDSPTGID
ncbi:MAG: penicillin-binding protein 2, partial [Deltaproteobacteria bacterium]